MVAESLKPRVLIIDDDHFLARSVARLLVEQGFEVEHAATAGDAWRTIEQGAPQLALLDLGLPDQDGVALCRRIRSRFVFPILMLTSRSQAIDKVLGLESGADDYLPKPFDGHELVARVRALLRRTQEYAEPNASSAHISGDFIVDEGARTVTCAGTTLDLTDTEFRIIVFLIKNAGKAVSREQLFDEIWGYDIEFNSNSLEVLIYRLRNKIAALGSESPIKTMRGFGYKWAN
ncbi:MAG: response regulator transcription factor [Fimbriimonadaceae bacterium]|nr:response regulator transcription factor [Fimbriimonadaceae bacterium]